MERLDNINMEEILKEQVLQFEKEILVRLIIAMLLSNKSLKEIIDVIKDWAQD